MLPTIDNKDIPQMKSPHMPEILGKYLALLNDLAPRYPEFMSRALESGNILGYIGEHADKGDPTALEIWTEMQERGLDIMPKG